MQEISGFFGTEAQAVNTKSEGHLEIISSSGGGYTQIWKGRRRSLGHSEKPGAGVRFQPVSLLNLLHKQQNP